MPSEAVARCSSDTRGAGRSIRLVGVRVLCTADSTFEGAWRSTTHTIPMRTEAYAYTEGMMYDPAARRQGGGGGRLPPRWSLGSPGSAVGCTALSGCEVPQRWMAEGRSAFTAHPRLIAQQHIEGHAVAAPPPLLAPQRAATWWRFVAPPAAVVEITSSHGGGLSASRKRQPSLRFTCATIPAADTPPLGKCSTMDGPARGARAQPCRVRLFADTWPASRGAERPALPRLDGLAAGRPTCSGPSIRTAAETDGKEGAGGRSSAATVGPCRPHGQRAPARGSWDRGGAWGGVGCTRWGLPAPFGRAAALGGSSRAPVGRARSAAGARLGPGRGVTPRAWLRGVWWWGWWPWWQRAPQTHPPLRVAVAAVGAAVGGALGVRLPTCRSS